MSAPRLLLFVVAAVAAVGCDSGGSPVADAASQDAPVTTDGAADAADAGLPADAAPGDVLVTGDSSNATCTFNADCPGYERCECDEATGCFCRIGPRGTGACGVDPCQDGNDCASALCVEGNGGTYYCSCPCTDDGSCGPQLPSCTTIAFLGRVCIR